MNDRPDDAPHLLVIGPTGAGKTTLAAAVIDARAGNVLIPDPKPTPGKWGGVPFVTVDDDGECGPIEAALQAVLAERKRRQAEMKHGITEFTPLTIVIDDFPDVKNECSSAPVLLKRLGSMGRELRIRLVALTQSNRVKTLGIEGEGDARDNFTIIRLGSFAVDALATAREMPRPAVLEWRGEYHPIDTIGLYGSHARPIPPDRWWRVPERTDDEVLGDLLGAAPAPSTAVEEQRPTTLADRILDVLRARAGQWLSASDIAREVDRTQQRVRPVLQQLVARGQIEQSREERSGQQVAVYRVTGAETPEMAETPRKKRGFHAGRRRGLRGLRDFR